MNRLSLSLFSISFFIIGSWAVINLPGSWPLLDIPPPPDPSWSALVNQTSILNIPLSGATCPITPYCSWRCAPKCTRSTDVVYCPRKNGL
ncbi:7470_t:CDS:1, partial [Ambispora leptoticha]